MSILDEFIESYGAKFAYVVPEFDDTVLGLIEQAEHLLLDERLSPPNSLKESILQLKARAREPMQVAIAGQFSSGKSTFLNAILSKNILPTGITPVTSKVNYIRYGDKMKIRVHYTDGRDEYQSVEDIARYTDQRGEVEQIEYLTLYAPLELLKEITFVDTPGLNSQNSTDTTTTQKILSEVDGIIWLSLMDNAGKLSEERTLSKYLGQYEGKSLCVLNQKDKFTATQIEQSVSYIEQNFSEFFSAVVPISAKQALASRSHDKAVLIEEELEQFLAHMATGIRAHRLDSISDEYEKYLSKTQEILSGDLLGNARLLEESNIQSVLEFVDTQIRPVAQSSKEFAIRRDISIICEKLISQHKIFMQIYDELAIELQEFEFEADMKLDELQSRFARELQIAYSQIEEIIEVISDDIYSHIGTTKRQRFMQKRALLTKSSLYTPVEYKTAKIDSDMIYKRLFYDDDIVGKMFKKYMRNLTEIEGRVNQNNALVYEMLKKRVRQWQSPYEMIRKQDPLYSYIEFANIRKFASKAYENILKPFNDEIQASYAKISSEFSYLSSAVSFNYQNATEVSVAFFEQRIEQSVALYEQNPTRFALYEPKLDEIRTRLTTSFHLYRLEEMMSHRNNFLHKNYTRLKREFKLINTDRLTLLQKRKERHERVIESLQRFITSIEVTVVSG